ncbi:basement membrane-specific heparan sulfate proteoglycan core protein isoform X6 [Fundulus heteroclitus]|uniref:basement membrane-specific heparan sulfate proteoglycan core protein isoform X6 n=1 Tax=Fundulus heteroclitus TaxID=8078 RepID=UPI00165B7EDC|nr:basement membrane-specific heparan sulfate proteoglycan core protein isoform X6 [Fundulus heteroclitus]
MGSPTSWSCGLMVSLILTCQLVSVTQASKVWGDLTLPEDLESEKDVQTSPSLLDDDEDFAADEASGERPSGEEDGSTPELDTTTIIRELESWYLGHIQSPNEPDYIFYRALVNFTDSVTYSPALEDILSPEFQEISEAVVDTLQSEYDKIPGIQAVTVVLIKKMIRESGVDVFVELDVGTVNNNNENQIRNVLYNVVKEGTIASYVTSVQGFQFRQLGKVEILPSVDPIAVPVTTVTRQCMADEFRCGDGTCILMEYVCDNRPDCRDLSDENNCDMMKSTPLVFTTPAAVTPSPIGPRPPVPPVRCRADQAKCQSGECISRIFLCDGQRDCQDGSDELECGTPSPCEPNEFKCRNGRCALKLWRCDGDNDCEDNSDEIDCPTKAPNDRCNPEQFECRSDGACIPASYQCDEEPDCSDRSDEFGCTPPSVVSPPEESIEAARGSTVTFTCQAVGVPTPIINWRLNWGHIPDSSRFIMTRENGRGTLTIRDVREEDQGAYTCEAINAKGLVFGIPDGVLTLISNPNPGNCPDGHFSVDNRCISCFCAGLSTNCKRTGRYRNQISLRFTEEENFKGVNVTYPFRPDTPPLSSTQLLINPEMQEFQLVDLSRRFINLESYWTLPRQFLGNKIDSYGGSLKYKVRYTLARGQSEPVTRSDVVLVGNGRRLVYRRGNGTPPNAVNQKEIIFTEDRWQHATGLPVSREDLMMTLANLESIGIRTIYDNHMVSVALSDVIMDTTTVEFSTLGHAKNVEECRCPPGYTGLSCELCSSGFERVPGGPYLGTCAGCNCNGHATACDPISGHCLSCQHNTEGPQCGRCRSGYFGDPTRGRPDDCKPCPCPYTETSRRFSDTCFLNIDQQPTCDACRPGYTGRRCEKCAPGYQGNPLQPNGKCVPSESSSCDNRGTTSSSSRPCSCKNNVAGDLCDECKAGFFHLSEANPDGCLRCFCMGVSSQCASSSWSRDQVRGGVNGQLFTLSNSANTKTISEGIFQRGSSVVYRPFSSGSNDVYFWVLPESFRGDKVTAYGGELSYTVSFEPYQRALVVDGQPDVVLQGNDIFLEHYSQTKPLPRVPQTVTVTFRESSWRRADGQPCTREHLLMALADVSLFMIRASYVDSIAETSISDIKMDIAVPQLTGKERALEVEECACPLGYRGASCQECDVGYTRTTSGLYLGTCERCDCNGHASSCDPETGKCLQCLHNTAGDRCERCVSGFYGDPVRGGLEACQPCPCPGISSSTQFSSTCYLGPDGEPVCDSCPPGFTGRRCERCSPGYNGNPLRGEACTLGNEVNGHCNSCDRTGTEGCYDRVCQCKMNVAGPSCSTCKPGTFHLSEANKDGCLSCFCMGVTQQCTSSTYYRDLVSSVFTPRNFQGFALVNRQRTSRVSTGFTVEISTEGTQLSYSNFNYLGQEPHYWQLPDVYQGDKKDSYFPRVKRADQSDSYLPEEQLRKDASVWTLMAADRKAKHRSKRDSQNDAQNLDDEVWALLSNFSNGRAGVPPFLPSSKSSSFSSSRVPTSSSSQWSLHNLSPPSPASGVSSSVRPTRPQSYSPGHAPRLQSKNTLSKTAGASGGSSKYALVYKGFSLHQDDVLYWTLPGQFTGEKVGSYGGKLKYTITYVAGSRGTELEDADVQIIGNDITLVARQAWQRRQQGGRERKQFEIIFREKNWRRPDGMPATREHLMMVLADLDDILIRASYSTEMLSSSISDVSMEVAVPNYSGLAQALEVEQCRCPPGYQGLSCQDCAPGYTRTGGGLYLGHCEPCDCNGHSDACHPETGICTNCLHNTQGEVCDQCAPGFFGDPTAGTPEDCQRCGCPHTDPDNQFSPTCESLGGGDYQCTSCQPGYTGQYCERCDTGYVGNPQERERCRPNDAAAHLEVKVFPERFVATQGSSVMLRCQVSGSPPHHFYWSRQDGQPISSRAERRRQGAELHFSSVQPSDAGIYICTCRDLRSSNRSHAEIIVTGGPAKPIEVTVEEPKSQTVRVGSTVNFICTARSKSPAYTLVWTRKGNRKLPNRATDFNGILTIQNVQPEDAGVYVCTGSNMFAMDESSAVLYVPEASQTQMFYTAYEMFEGHRKPAEGAQPIATITPSVLNVPLGQRAEFRCTVTGNPMPAIEWIGGPGNRMSPRAVIRNGILTFPAVDRADEGEYTCRALNTHGEHTARASLHVQTAEGAQPIATITPSVLNVPLGQRAEFRCTVTGNPTPAIEWIGGPGNRMSPRAVIRNGILTFPAVDRADEGEYTCRALNTHGEHTARASLHVQTNNPIGLGTQPQVQVSPPNVNIHEGEPLRMYCRATGSPTPKLTWLKNGGQLPPQAIPSHGFHQFKSNSLDVLHRRIEELQSQTERTDIGTLFIPSVKMSDAGTYMCVGSNSVGSNSAPIRVAVIRPEPAFSGVTIHPSIADVQEGQSLELNCFPPGNPPPRVTWTRAGGQFSTNHQVVGSKLRILSASSEDSGEYICRVQGAGSPGSPVHQASVSVSVTSSSSRLQSPIIGIEPHSSAVRVGESARFRCQVYSGNQPVRLEWKRADNQPLADNVRVSPDGSVLTISNARPMNHGAYRCVASNPFGITHTIVSLIVKESPGAAVTPVGPVRVRVGEPINLECQATGEPRPSVSWHRLDNNRRTTLSSPVPMDSNAVMQILAARPEDSGTYVCVTRNTEGSTETKVEVIVEGGSQIPSAPRALVPEPLMVVVEGRPATLRCDAYGFPSPVIRWSKLRSSLPWRHKVVNNSLVLPDVGRQDSGEYICSATNNMGTSEVTIMLEVETPPYATSVPDDVAVRVGEVIRLQCLAHGTPPLTYTWTKLDGVLPPRAQTSEGDLQIDLATAEDAGSYKCVASNRVGNTEVVARVTVRSPLAVRVSPQVEVKAQGSAVEFTCSAAGGVETKIEWLKEGGALPPNSYINDGVLRIENLEQSNEGIYICRASSAFGQAQDTARLTIQALPKVMINVRTSMQTVMIGNSVEFECHAVGDPEPTVRWSKVGGSLPSHIMVKDGMLRIDQVTEADAGHYRCTATNDVGSVQSQVLLNVQSLPQISALPETKEVTVGSDAVMPCLASGYPVPDIKWTKSEGELPPKCFQEANVLTVPQVTHEDSGTYVCTASNEHGNVAAFTKLEVHERVMPYFAQEPVSYLTLPTIKNAYKAFNIKINFRPDNVDGLILYAGMILYNGQRRTTGADFISLGLVSGRLEFRFDVGSGMATIRDPNPIKLGEFHTVELHRNLTQGSITVDGGEPISGKSQGKFQGLDLNEELHVGGYPNYTSIAKTAGIKTGFVGCIRQLVIQGEEVIFKELDRSSTGVTNCPTCKDYPCQNGGRCEDSEASLYRCTCPRGFTGSNCQHHSSLHCHSEACGPDATCINRPNGLGYDCRCHLGKFGNKCMQGELVTTPLFDGDESYIAYPPLTNVHDDLRVELEFKPLQRNGLMFFCGGKKTKVEDFVSVSMVEGHVEFRYELGTGQALLLSPQPVSLGQWHRVVAERNKKAGHLRVDHGPVQRMISPGKAQGLNIHTHMYLGGVPSMDILPRRANVTQMFDGCIGEVSINNKKVDLSYSFTESKSISNCVDNSPCDRRPCLNGGECMSSAEYEYQCLCKDGFEGERCEVVRFVCQSDIQCQNGGTCVNGRCVCTAGHTGLSCEESQVFTFAEAQRSSESSEANDSPYQYAAHFQNDGYIALPKSIFPRSAHGSPETIEMEINTSSSEGLILWQGVVPGEHGKGKDFISLGLQNGHVVFSYQLGSGESRIRSIKAINDGKWHKITAARFGKDGYIQIDGGDKQHGQSKGKSLMVNTKGSIYLGGAPDMTAMTGGKFSSGITGCIRNLMLVNAQPGPQPAQAVDLQVHDAHSVNVQPCSS